MAKTSKSIQAILNKRRDELFTLIDDGASIPELHKVVLDCIKEAEASGNASAAEAREIFDNCKKKNVYNLYLSTLMTYLTGMKVS